MRRAAAVVLSAAIAYTGVSFAHNGLQLAAVLTIVVGIALSVVALRMPQFRRAAVPAIVFFVATLAFEGWYIAISFGYATWWPRRLGIVAFVLVTVFVVAVAGELFVPRSVSGVRPASPVAAAALMVIPTFGVDVNTALHGPDPALAALVVIAVGHALRPRGVVMRIVEPIAAVCAGWATARVVGGYLPYDAWWLTQLFALPAVAAALLVAAIRSRR